ncbi:MAG: hypothetical protein ABIO88_08100 [Burkholderiaceae bacterium]
MPVKSITLIPVAAPDKLSTKNKGAPLVGALWAGIANTILDKGKSAEFDTKYAAYRLNMGTKLTEAVMRELQTQGFKVLLALALVPLLICRCSTIWLGWNVLNQIARRSEPVFARGG